MILICVPFFFHFHLSIPSHAFTFIILHLASKQTKTHSLAGNVFAFNHFQLQLFSRFYPHIRACGSIQFQKAAIHWIIQRLVHIAHKYMLLYAIIHAFSTIFRWSCDSDSHIHDIHGQLTNYQHLNKYTFRPYANDNI